MNRLLTVVAILLVASGCWNDSDSNSVDSQARQLPIHAVDPVATIDDRSIGPEKFNEVAEGTLARVSDRELKANTDQLVDIILDRIVDYHLVDRKLEGEDIEVDDARADRELDHQRRRLGGEQSLEQTLDNQKMSEDLYREELRRGLRMQAYLVDQGKIEAEFTDEQLRAHMKANPGNYRDEAEEQVTFTEVVFKRETADQLERATERAEQISENAQTEQQLVEIGRQALEDEDLEGEIRTDESIRRLTRDSHLHDFVFDNLGVGEISIAVPSPEGIHVIKKLDHQGAVPNLDEIRSKIEADLMFEQISKIGPEFLDELAEQADIEIHRDNIVVDVDDTDAAPP